MDLTEASMAPLQLHVWRAFIAFRFRFFKNDDAMNMMYMMYTNLMLSCDMNCQIPYITYISHMLSIVSCLTFTKTHLTSYIVGHRIPQFQAGRRPPARQLMLALRCLGATWGQRWRSLWVFLGCLRSKSWEIQTFFIPNFQLMKIQQAPFSKALSCVEYGDLWPVRMP